MAQEFFKNSPAFPRDDSIPCHKTLEIAKILAVLQFFLSESGALSAQMMLVTFGREPLVRADSSAAPTKVTPVSFLSLRHADAVKRRLVGRAHSPASG